MAAVSVAMRGRALARPFEPCARPPSTATSFPREPALSLLRPVNSNAPRRSFAAHVATNDINTEYEVNTDQGDYYSILGLTPAATPKEIKASYRKVMKDYHPDLSNDADANDFAIFLNQVYEVRVKVV